MLRMTVLLVSFVFGSTEARVEIGLPHF